MIDAQVSYYDRFLHSVEWQFKRLEVIGRDNHSCRICGCTDSICVHHFGYSEAIMLDDWNLITLCEKCHRIISDKVIELNSYTFKEKLERGFFEDFCANTVRDLYIKSYCKNGDKSKNFLELRRIKSTINIVRITFLLQKKSQDRKLDEIESIRLRDVNFQMKSQELISEYRKQYILTALQASEPPYSIKRYLGISNNTYGKLVKGDGSG
ncbi:MAG: hypothetical protein K2M82_04490 [Lachnospiraceae bacterium]|nr:hypothetical protein [Lachnospiraceae bacterium]